MSNKTYLVVFLGEFRGNKIYDKGDDPCFCAPPTWGICRSNVRKYLKVGDTLFFLAEINKIYYLKGWFEVGEKIDYLSALERFPDRKNVIISRQQNPHIVFWENKALKECYRNRHNNRCPNFLSKLVTQQGTFYQNQIDRHKIDNWKCRRILNCEFEKLTQCIQNNSCGKNGVDICDDNNKYKNYIVANPNKGDDVDYLGITLADIEKVTGIKKEKVETPCYQHNPLKLHFCEEKILLGLIKAKKLSSKLLVM
jgi:hypothetical protein